VQAGERERERERRQAGDAGEKGWCEGGRKTARCFIDGGGVMDRCDIIALRRSAPNRIRVQGAGLHNARGAQGAARTPLGAASCIKGPLTPPFPSSSSSSSSSSSTTIRSARIILRSSRGWKRKKKERTTGNVGGPPPSPSPVNSRSPFSLPPRCLPLRFLRHSSILFLAPSRPRASHRHPLRCPPFPPPPRDSALQCIALQ